MDTNKYGYLGKYLDFTHADYEARKKREEEANSRYGHLLDYAKPDRKTLDLMAKMEDERHMRRMQSAIERKAEEQRIQARIEEQRQREQERIDRNSAIVDEIMARKDAITKAVADKAEQERMKAEEKQRMYGKIEGLMDISPRAANALINAMQQGNAFKGM